MRTLGTPLHCIVLLFFLAIIGCSERQQEAFKTVQICVADHQGIVRLATIMQQAAQAEGMTYVDNTATARRGLTATAQSDRDRRDADWVVNLGIQGRHGIGVTASNLGLSPFQIALGFSSGTDRLNATSFADRLVARLRTQWQVIPVPQGQDLRRVAAC